MARFYKKIIIIGLIILVGFMGVMRFMPHGGGWGGPGGAVPVNVAEVIEREVQLWHEFSGMLVAVDQADIRPQISGTIDSVHFTNGAMVNKGDLLFIIDPRPYEAAVQAASARAVLAESELTRAESLLKDKAISQRDYDQRKNAAAVARADLVRAKLDLNYTHIKAPITGRVSRAEITVGNLVEAGPNAPLLTTVVASSPVYADFEVDEKTYLEYVKTGGSLNAQQDIPVMIELEGANATRSGHVESFDNRLNTTSGTMRVRAVFDNPDSVLVPGLFVRAKLGTAGKEKALLITERAIGTDQNRKFVLVVGADNKAERREVKLGDMADGFRVIKEGLKPGEKIVVSGLQRVMMPGQPVIPEVVAMDAPPVDPNAKPPAAADAAPAAGETTPEKPAEEVKPAKGEPPIPEPITAPVQEPAKE